MKLNSVWKAGIGELQSLKVCFAIILKPILKFSVWDINILTGQASYFKPFFYLIFFHTSDC